MRPFVTTLDTDVIPTLIGVIDGSVPPSAAVGQAYNDMESYALSLALPSPVQVPAPQAMAPMSRAQVLTTLETLRPGKPRAAGPLLPILIQLLPALLALLKQLFPNWPIPVPPAPTP